MGEGRGELKAWDTAGVVGRSEGVAGRVAHRQVGKGQCGVGRIRDQDPVREPLVEERAAGRRIGSRDGVTGARVYGERLGLGSRLHGDGRGHGYIGRRLTRRRGPGKHRVNTSSRESKDGQRAC